ncbi:MAG: acyl-CoA dehydrogenase [Nevskia sp.]|nr:acyl-CoA dehydrogenase [Nevskia sp.]
MNFDFSEEQQALREQARRLFADGRSRARRLLDSGDAHDASLWTQLVEMGLSAAAIPEPLGGVGLGALELCVVAEEAGRSLAPVPFASSVLYATEALKLAGGAAATRWLPKLADGSAIGTVAFTEGHGTWDARPTARVENGRLFGFKEPVADPAADFAIVSATSKALNGGYDWWLVDLHAEGVVVQAIDTLDCLRRHARIEFDGAPVAALGQLGDGARLASRMLDIAAVLTAFEQLGGAEAQLEACVDYAKTRRAFGSLIGVNQGVKHRLADMYAKIQLARGHCYYAAWALSTTAAQLPLAAAGARLAATDAFSFAAEEAIELHGGIGFTWDNDCHLYYRRARLLALTLGNRSRWSDRLVRALCLRRANASSEAAA